MRSIKTPQVNHYEVWTHILAFNLIRENIAQAVTMHGVEPRTVTFKAALRTLGAFQLPIHFQGGRGKSFRDALVRQLLNAVASPGR